MARRRRTDEHADVAVPGPTPYNACDEIGYEKHPEPGYGKFLRIRPNQSIRDAEAEQAEQMAQNGMIY